MPKGVQGYCKVIGCNEPATCTWKNKLVCSKHYFEFRKLYSLAVREKHRNQRLENGY